MYVRMYVQYNFMYDSTWRYSGPWCRRHWTNLMHDKETINRAIGNVSRALVCSGSRMNTGLCGHITLILLKHRLQALYRKTPVYVQEC